MGLWVVECDALPAAGDPFTFTVPGHQTWALISVCATLARDVGAFPNRGLTLRITDGTTTVVTTPAEDVGTEPGTLEVTWANMSPAAVAVAGDGVSNGPLAPLLLKPGYVITGAIVNGAAADQWLSAVAWFNYGR